MYQAEPTKTDDNSDKVQMPVLASGERKQLRQDSPNVHRPTRAAVRPTYILHVQNVYQSNILIC